MSIINRLREEALELRDAAHDLLEVENSESSEERAERMATVREMLRMANILDDILRTEVVGKIANERRPSWQFAVAGLLVGSAPLWLAALAKLLGLF